MFSEVRPWTNVYGLARSLLALATAGTLVCNNSTVLFHPTSANPDALRMVGGPAMFGIFHLFGAQHLELARWIAVVVLAIVATGWQPRITALLHWWVAASFQVNAVVLDGGDQVASVLTLLLLPVALTDSRVWHWSKSCERHGSENVTTSRIVGAIGLIGVRVQVSGIYFHAALGKCKVPEWSDGTALYYWFTHPTFGAPAYLAPFIGIVTRHGALLTTMTWSVVALEFLLAAALVMPQKGWRATLVLGIALHMGIAIIHGLMSFSIVMVSALILYLWPAEREIHTGGWRLSCISNKEAGQARRRDTGGL